MIARSLVALLVAACIVAGCGRDVIARRAVQASELRWYRELALDNAHVPGAAIPVIAMNVDPGGGLWVAFAQSVSGKSHLYYRAPVPASESSGAWQRVLERETVSEATLSSVRAGEVFFGFNRPMAGFEPNLLRVTPERAEPVLVPLERIDDDDKEYLQVGAYAMLSDRDGWACGARGRIWHWDGAAWSVVAPVFAWSKDGPVNASYCLSVRFDAPDRGWMSTVDGQLATWDGRAWQRVEGAGEDAIVALTPANGIGARDGKLQRWSPGEGWKPLAAPRPLGSAASTIFDARGAWALDGDDVLSLDTARTWRAPRSQAHGSLAAIGNDLWFATTDGIYRTTSSNAPTFEHAPAGAIPAPIVGKVAADLDDDGDEDVIGIGVRADNTAFSGNLLVFMNDGAGKFVQKSGSFPPDMRAIGAVDVADIDGDGRFDVIASPGLQESASVEVFHGNGDGTFERIATLENVGDIVRAVDVDGDGDLDLPNLARRAHVLVNDGVGHFTPGPLVAMPKGVEQTAWIDADDDGDLDAIAQRWRDPAVLLRNDGAAGFAHVPLPLVIEGAAVADVDRDGRPELYAQIVHVRSEQRPFTRCVLNRDGCAPELTRIPAGAFADLNLDGRLDVVQHDLRGDLMFASEGHVHIATDEGYAPVTSITGALPHPLVFDANGDGVPDVIAHRDLLLGRNVDAPFVRVRIRASNGNRFARGARVLVKRAGTSSIVASEIANTGTVLAGVPDRDAVYDVEVRFPDGRVSVHRGVAPRSDVLARDASGLEWYARLVSLWCRQTVRLGDARRELAFLLATLAALGAASWRVQRLRSSRARATTLAFFVIAYAVLVGFAVRARGAWPYLLGPGALCVAVGATAAAFWISERRASRRVGSYALLEKLGEGAAATVWRARRGGRTVALKVFSLESMQISDARDRFFREARVGSEIEHDNLVRILDVGRTDDGRSYLAMQLVEGRSLDRVLRDGPLSPERARLIARDVASALAALHREDVVHRDIKPGNIMIRPDGTAVVTDLGLVRSALFRTVTRHNVAVGTLAYMSPEQCVSPDVDGRSDVWSLGVVLYEMLAGKRPFDATHELELVYRIHNTRPPPLPASVPAALASVVARCLARRPAARFASADDVAAALTQAKAAA